MRADPFAWMMRASLWMLAVGLLALVLASGQATRLDNALYDAHMRHWSYAPGDNVVIVAIDPKSLAALGRWPWPRTLHARLIDRLATEGVRGIGLDVTTSEPDAVHPENDRALAKAARQEGHVVLPVFAEASDLGGPLVEMLPVPTIARGAAALGQVDVAKDADGITRGAYLKAGLGQPYWPSLALALYRVGQPPGKAFPPGTLPGLRNGLQENASPYQWIRDNYVLLRYAGPAGSFGRVSYVDALNGNVPGKLLKGRWVLVGATAEGLGDLIATPTASNQHPMPGVEYQANLLESLLRGMAVTPLNFPAQFLLGGGVLALPLLLYGLPGFRRAWRVALASGLFTLLLSLLLLRMGHLWWPPVACLLVTVLGLALHWVWTRLETSRSTADTREAVVRAVLNVP